MNVRFGLHRDGLEPTPDENAVGRPTVGRHGLLRLLESDLGLATPSHHVAEEVDLYRECLEELDDLSRFYHGSLNVDPVGVASTLLDWRHEWYLAGWDGTFSNRDGVSSRLADMAAVEQLARQRLPPCEGQRIARVLTALETGDTQIECVELLTHKDDLPLRWQQLLERLGAVSVDESTGEAPPDTDLGKVQALLLRGEAARTLDGDGTLVVLKAISPDVSAQATAELLRAGRARESTVLIAPEDGIILDNALDRVGLPRAGYQHYSPFRAASQVLKLALSLIWQPVDANRLLQFLVHPVCPLSWPVRSRLAVAVAGQPGIGGPDWRAAMEKLEEKGQDTSEVAYWVPDPSRLHPADGAPTVDVLERVAKVRSWLGERIAAAKLQEEPSRQQEMLDVYSTAFRQAKALASILDGRRERIARTELDRLVDEVTRPMPDAGTFSEAGHVPATLYPGNVCVPVDEVLWWGLAPKRLNLAPVWSKAELGELNEAGVLVRTPQQRLAEETRAWQRPVFNCRRRLVLVIRDDDTGARHPLWGRIESQFKIGWVEVALDDGLTRGDQAKLCGAVEAPTLGVRMLPARRRWWQLGRPIPSRKKESYTSLDKAYNYPHQWLLGYHAKLRGNRLVEVADEALLKGSLAHRLFEQFFKEHDQWSELSEAELDRWLEESITALIETEGAVLLGSGRGIEHQQLATTLERSLKELVYQLKGARVIRVYSEQKIEKPLPRSAADTSDTYDEVTLQGNADLVLVREDGARAVLDAKWGGANFQQKKMKQGRHLQLGTYSFGLAENDWPTAGYYIITSGEFLMPDRKFFRDVRNRDGSTSPEEVWQRSLVTRDWRLAQFAEGRIEVVAGAESDTEAPADGLAMKDEKDRFDDFAHLVGWEPFE